jgi:hypothetical protein
VLIRASTRRLARYEWMEGRLFEVLGAWSLDGGDADASRLFATASHHHAWHAGLWAERRPLLHDLDPTSLATPDELVAAVRAVAESEPAGRVAAYADIVLPALLEVYGAHLGEASAVADAPVMRALRLVIADANEDRQAARALLDAVTPGGDGIDRAAARRSSLAELLLQSG